VSFRIAPIVVSSSVEPEHFLILEDAQGHRFGEYPRQPGEKTPSELLAEAERIKAQKRSLAR
jgi:hypothetical protein